MIKRVKHVLNYSVCWLPIATLKDFLIKFKARIFKDSSMNKVNYHFIS